MLRLTRCLCFGSFLPSNKRPAATINDSGPWHLKSPCFGVAMRWGTLTFFFFSLKTKANQNTNPGVFWPPSVYTLPLPHTGISPCHERLRQAQPCPSAVSQPFTCTSVSQNNNQAALSPKFPQNTVQVPEMCPCRCGVGNPGYLVCSLQVFFIASPYQPYNLERKYLCLLSTC